MGSDVPGTPNNKDIRRFRHFPPLFFVSSQFECSISHEGCEYKPVFASLKNNGEGIEFRNCAVLMSCEFSERLLAGKTP
jgi:hypothetical protein